MKLFVAQQMTLPARLAYVNFDGAAVLQASKEIPLEKELDEQFFRKHGQKTLKGIEVIAEWCRDLV